MRRRLQKIKSELDGVRRRRTLHMDRRKKSAIPMATLVGYTNAGKSTLFNALANAGTGEASLAANQLFSTLDPVTRRIRLPSGAPLLLSDTVGFIQKLSPNVIAAFRATLDELDRADVLLHVIDVSHPKAPEQTEVVEQTLDELGLGERPRLLVINKMDLLTDSAGPSSELADAGALSPRRGVGEGRGGRRARVGGKGLEPGPPAGRNRRATGQSRWPVADDRGIRKRLAVRAQFDAGSSPSP